VESNLVQREKLEESKVLQEQILAVLCTRKHQKVEELVGAIRKIDRSVPIENIREEIESLQDDGKVVLADSPIDGSFVNYVADFSTNLPFWLGLGAITLCLMTIFVFPNIEPFKIIRIITGGASALFLPGYGLVGLIFAKKGLPLVECFGVSFMLSFALILVLWLVLDNSPLGADINSTVMFTSAAGVLLIIGSTYRQFLLRKSIKSGN